MISNKEITEFIANEIDANQGYFIDKYNRPLLIMIGVDVNNPPEEADMPLMIIEPTIKNIGDNASDFDYEIVLHYAIEGDNNPIKNGNIVVYSGIYDIEDDGNYLVELLRGSFQCKTNLEMFDIDFYHNEINAFPVYSGTIVVGFSVPNIIGDQKITFQ
ncbi:hypothetical protein NrS5_45 [Nitratiruptor phage NrS-5]|uniref:hypothetical protein n=1 Tax=unclassified Nitratiruptor TaxID=2624044 RepID=UPI0019152F63|nr:MULTISPECIES: hypothetical protein [unclassified Nitratiruptor]BCD61749.1 hypothetical protein NitYY0813_C0609 [Nitratiruptor sp. YY08-13]BCD65684.1 hypothetical protein NitYY0826_C0611 [Nitratiruptor sp. YY08-26]BCD83227.1 hypothetical protein NrS4_45 [Nitratiruptor phage NrS-4]BCD83286.1 hypothetical protein NrS5_45 [Nitratiruptor phage NrS-5]